jgi:hypothetical protein
MQSRSLTMKIQAVSAFVLAAMTSVAFATPAKTEATERVSYGATAKRGTLAPAEDWVELASPTPASHGREYIALEAGGPYVRLRVDATSGRPIVRSVRIDFKDGTSRTVRIDRALAKATPAYIDLRGNKLVERLVVTSEGGKFARYGVSAEPSGTGVASRESRAQRPHTVR